MTRTIFCWLILLLIATAAFSQEEDFKALSEHFLQAKSLFADGRYQKTIDELQEQEAKLPYLDRVKFKGFLSYWKALCHKKLQNHNQAVAAFKAAVDARFTSQDLEYEYAQSLYALNENEQAKDFFTRSYRKNFKPAVSLYYLASMLEVEGDLANAPVLLNRIRTVEDKDKAEVLQPAESLLGDIYLQDAQDKQNIKDLVERIVIPQYERAIKVNPKSALVGELNQKIRRLKKEYGLFLFEMINGRQTMIPRYAANANLETGFDTNVLFSPAETTISKAKQGSGFLRADVFGRYAFYPNNRFSILPEFRFNRTHYLNRIPEIYRNDNYLIAPAIRTTFEHSWWDRPASLLFDYEFQNSQRDVNAEEKLVFSSSTHLFTLGERFNVFSFGETTFKLRHRRLHSYLTNADSEGRGAALEQFVMMGKDFLMLSANYDQTRVDDLLFNTDVLGIRGDYIMSSAQSWFTPSFGLGLQFTDPINDRDNRGTEIMLNPMIKLAHTFGQKLRWGLRLDYQQNDSKDEANFSYRKTIISTDLNYQF